MIGRKGRHPDVGQSRLMRPSYYVLCKSNSNDNTYLLLSCSYFALVWIKCASLFCLHIDMRTYSSVWAKSQVHGRKDDFTAIIVVVIYRNIYRERNDKVFNNKTSIVDCCVVRLI